MEQIKKQYPQGYFIRLWIWILLVLFTGGGIALAIVIDNNGMILIGLAVGITVGAVIGVLVEKKCKKNGWIRPLTEYEKKKRKISIVSTIVLAILALVGYCTIIFQ